MMKDKVNINERTTGKGVYGTFYVLTFLMSLMGVGYGLIILADAIPNFWIKGFLSLLGLVVLGFTTIATWHALKTIYKALTEEADKTRDGSDKVG